MKAETQERTNVESVKTLPKKKVLIADDNLEFLAILDMALKDLGYEVTMTRNGAQAYEKILANDFDLVILDVNMPRMNGVEAVKAIRKRNPYLYIIMFSGEATKSEMADAIVYGADRFLTKPLGIKRLIEEIQQIDCLRHE